MRIQSMLEPLAVHLPDFPYVRTHTMTPLPFLGAYY
jgi:hypothetical protein